VVRSLVIALFVFALTCWAAPAGAADQPAPAKPSTKAGAAKTPKTKSATAATPKVKAPAQSPAATPAGPAAAPPADAKAGESKPADTDKPEGHKPIEGKVAPHFASLRPDKVFLRSGPSSDFPVQWVFQRRGLPVEVLANFDIWRKIRDIDGTEGWVNQQMLTSRRSLLITGGVRNIRREPDATSEIVAQLEPGVVAAMSHCNPDWCEVKAGGYKGWVKRDEVWGIEPGEVVP